MTTKALRRVLVLVNPKSGLTRSFDAIRRAMDRWWDGSETDLRYQFTQSQDDCTAKVRRALAAGVDVMLVAGGDGTVSTVGRLLVGTDVAMGVIPAGSGNGFARHFGTPLSPARAVRALANADEKRIDVGVVEGLPFLVTCSMAWDASIASAFQKSPIRGVLPYVFAGVHQFFGYRPQEMKVLIDEREALVFPDPLVFTIANLTQYGGGAVIAADAQEDDGFLELVVVLRQDVPKLVANLGRLFDGSLAKIPEVVSRRFRRLRVWRQHPSALQMDGELVDAPVQLDVTVIARSLKVLVPRG